MNHVIQCDLWRHRYSLLRHHFWSSTDTASPDVTTTVVPTTADVIKPDRKRRPVTPEVTLTDVFFKISLVFRSSNLRVILAQGPCSMLHFRRTFWCFFGFNKAVNDRVEKVIWRSKCIKIAKKLIKKISILIFEWPGTSDLPSSYIIRLSQIQLREVVTSIPPRIIKIGQKLWFRAIFTAIFEVLFW